MRQQRNDPQLFQYGIYALLIIFAGLFEYFSGGLAFDHVSALQDYTRAYYTSLKYSYTTKAELCKRILEIDAENQRLSLMNHQLRYDLHASNGMAKENTRLRKLIRHAPRTQNIIFAKLVRVFNQPSAHVLYVKTSDIAVKSGMYAINDQGRVIGRVNAATNQAARILLHNDKRSAIPVVIGDQRVGAIAVGIGSGTELIHIPIDSNIRAAMMPMQYASLYALYYTMDQIVYKQRLKNISHC